MTPTTNYYDRITGAAGADVVVVRRTRNLDPGRAVVSASLVVKANENATTALWQGTITPTSSDAGVIADTGGSSRTFVGRWVIPAAVTLPFVDVQYFVIEQLFDDNTRHVSHRGVVDLEPAVLTTVQTPPITPALPTDMVLDWDAALGPGAGGALQERVQGKHALVVAGAPWFRSDMPLLMMDGNDGLEAANVPVPQGDFTMMGVARIDTDASIMQLWGWLAANPSPGVGSSNLRDFVTRSAMLDPLVTVSDQPVNVSVMLTAAASGPALTPYYLCVARRVTADTIEAYVSGRLVASQSRGDSTIDKRRGATGTFGFGKVPGSSSLFLIGGIGRLFVVERAMTPTQIEAAHLKLRETYTRLPAPGVLLTPEPIPRTNLAHDWSPAAGQFTDRVGSAHAAYDAGAGAPTLISTWPPLARFSGAQGASVANISMALPFGGIVVLRLDALAIGAAAMHIVGMAPVGVDGVTYHRRLSIVSAALTGILVAQAQAMPLTIAAAEPSVRNSSTFPKLVTLGWSGDVDRIVRLYVNGVERGSADLGNAGDFPNEPATGTYTFGRTPTNTEYLTGLLGRALRWEGRAPTAAELRVAHNALREQYEGLPLA